MTSAFHESFDRFVNGIWLSTICLRLCNHNCCINTFVRSSEKSYDQDIFLGQTWTNRRQRNTLFSIKVCAWGCRLYKPRIDTITRSKGRFISYDTGRDLTATSCTGRWRIVWRVSFKTHVSLFNTGAGIFPYITCRNGSATLYVNSPIWLFIRMFVRMEPTRVEMYNVNPS